MVVCKCRKATKLYCFVHKIPVCGECICFSEHQLCVVRTYSEWVIDGDYDWPTNCCHCQQVLVQGTETQTTRLGCLHVVHTSCLVSHIKSFPPQTAPAGYICPACQTAIWPPKSVKDSGSRLHSKLKEAILQTGMEKNLIGTESRNPPPAFQSEPLMHPYVGKDFTLNTIASSRPASLEIVEIDGPTSVSSLHNHDPSFINNGGPTAPGANTRKGAVQVDRQNSDMSYYGDDEDGNRKKYSRRGTLRHKVFRSILPFWSTSPVLPVTAPPRKDTSYADSSETRARHNKSSRMDPRKLLLVIAIMACMATMGILYYRIAQRGLGEEKPDIDIDPQ